LKLADARTPIQAARLRSERLLPYELFDRLAWQFTYDPREIEGGSRVIQGDWVYLYKDAETGRVADLQDYLGRVGRLIAAGTGENAIIYAGRLLGTLRKK
jgi:hypothetical protein